MTSKENFCNNEIINSTLLELVNSINDDNEIFLSENDFKFSFAQLLAKPEDVKNIILEYPIQTHKLYEKSDECKQTFYDNYKKSKKFNEERTYIDLYFEYKHQKYFVEFKYKLKFIEHPVKRYKNRDFFIKSHLASNIGRHQVYEDIERMENIKKCFHNSHSFVIFVTNDSNYWEKNTTNFPESSDFKFQLKDGKNTNNNKLEYLGGAKRKNSEEKYSRRTLYLKNSYKISWLDFKNIRDTKNSKFRILIFDCDNHI